VRRLKNRLFPRGTDEMIASRSRKRAPARGGNFDRIDRIDRMAAKERTEQRNDRFTRANGDNRGGKFRSQKPISSFILPNSPVPAIRSWPGVLLADFPQSHSDPALVAVWLQPTESCAQNPPRRVATFDRHTHHLRYRPLKGNLTMSISRTVHAAASHQRIPIVVANADRGKTTRNHVLQLAMQKATERSPKSRSDQTMVGMARCAVPVAGRSVRQRNESPQAFTSPTPPQRASACAFPQVAERPNDGRDGALRRPRCRAQR